MNNKLYRFFSILALIVGLSVTANAAPIYYTLTGVVTVADNTDGSLTHSVGDKVSYVFLVDFDLQGSRTIDGTTTYYTDTLQTDFFHADYIGGDIEPASLYKNISGGAITNYEENNGIDSIGANYGRVNVGDSLYTYANTYVHNWIVGTTGTFWNSTSAGLGTTSSLYGNWTVTAVSAINPVPIPAAIWLLGSGLIGLIGVARRRRSS